MTSRLRVPVNADDHVRGPMDAPLELVKYGDFECPACSQAHLVVKHLERTLGRQLRFAFRHFPLLQAHSRALGAAKAAEAAGIQGKFWEMYDKLYESQADLSESRLITHAADLGLDIEDYIADSRSPFVAKRIETDFLHGVRSGVNGTPTFFVNGLRHDGSWSYATLLEALRTPAVRAPASRAG